MTIILRLTNRLLDYIQVRSNLLVYSLWISHENLVTLPYDKHSTIEPLYRNEITLELMLTLYSGSYKSVERWLLEIFPAVTILMNGRNPIPYFVVQISINSHESLTDNQNNDDSQQYDPPHVLLPIL